MIRSTERTCYKRPGAAVEQTMGALESMGKALRESNGKASSDGWNNWRRNCEPKPTDRKRYGGSTFLKRMERNGRLEFQYAYRPKRSAHDAVRKVHELIFFMLITS